MKKIAAAPVVILSSASIAQSSSTIRGVVLQSCERVNKFCVARVVNVSHKNVVVLGIGMYQDGHLGTQARGGGETRRRYETTTIRRSVRCRSSSSRTR